MPKVNSKRKLSVNLPVILGSTDYQPTGLMIKTLAVYLTALEGGEEVAEYDALVAASGKQGKRGYTSLWYQWCKKPGFLRWWNEAKAEYHATINLSRVHDTLFRCARKPIGTHSADRKTYLERFDKDYKPQHAEEHRFPGIMPPDEIETRAERSRARARQFAAKNVESKEVESSNSTTPHSQDEPETKDSQSENETIQGNADPPPPLSEGAR